MRLDRQLGYFLHVPREAEAQHAGVGAEPLVGLPTPHPVPTTGLHQYWKARLAMLSASVEPLRISRWLAASNA